MTFKKFRSLMFREFRLSRKNIILQFGLLLAYIALTQAMLLSLGENDITGDELSGMVEVIILMNTYIGAMPLLMDEGFKADINSGWLIYSYALPIKPVERTAARFIRRLSVSLGSALLSLCNAAVICARMGKPFGVNYIVWNMVIFSAALLYSLLNNFFILRARNGDAMKKAQTNAGMASTALMIVMIAVIYKASGVSLVNLTESNRLFDLPVFDAKALVWAVPLLLAMMAACFFTAYLGFKSAYSNVPDLKRAGSEKHESAAKTDAAEKALPAAKTNGAVGLLYKELKQNRLVFILTAAAPILLTAFPFCFSAIGVITGGTSVEEMFETTTNVYIRALMCATGLFVAAGLMSELFSGDDRKLWAYFIVSTPGGVKGFLYRKYVVTLMLNLIYMISGILAEHLLMTVNYFVTGKELTTSMQPFYLSGVFVLMAISTLDIPFMVRYGSKKGSIVKMIVMLLICTAAIAAFNLLSEDIKERLVNALVSFFNGGENNMLVLTMILSFFPYITFAAYLLSYRITCGVFMKGVNEYDK